MMPQLNTPVSVPPLGVRLDFDSGVVSLGSCFADEVGRRLLDGGFRVELNPFGTLYNPASIALALDRIIDESEITTDDLVEHEGLWHSWHHHGSFSNPAKEATLATCNARIHQAHRALREARLLMITFGTAWVFEHNGQVVANCHKLPPKEFVRRRMEVEEIVNLWRPLQEKLAAFNPQLATLYAVSPIRHLADGAHGNQLSKSTLLLAVEQLIQHGGCYFPSYEIVLDELRDYRFFGPDMVHPTELAVDVVWDRFQQATMAPSVCEQARLNAKQYKRERHIPIHR